MSDKNNEKLCMTCEHNRYDAIECDHYCGNKESIFCGVSTEHIIGCESWEEK